MLIQTAIDTSQVNNGIKTTETFCLNILLTVGDEALQETACDVLIDDVISARRSLRRKMMVW
jgi:hypothetical protein